MRLNVLVNFILQTAQDKNLRISGTKRQNDSKLGLDPWKIRPKLNNTKLWLSRIKPRQNVFPGIYRNSNEAKCLIWSKHFGKIRVSNRSWTWYREAYQLTMFQLHFFQSNCKDIHAGCIQWDSSVIEEIFTSHGRLRLAELPTANQVQERQGWIAFGKHLSMFCVKHRKHGSKRFVM